MITHAMLLLALAAPSAPLADAVLVDAVKVDNVLAHLQAFQSIADAHGGNRAAGLPGYDASAAYVADRLRRAGYAVRMQPFAFEFYRELAPAVLEGEERYGDVTTLTYSGSGEVAAAPQAAGSGCAAGDFQGFVPGRVAVVRRGACTFAVKVRNAAAAGAAAMVVVNDQAGAFGGSLGTPQRIPVVGVGSAAGPRIVKERRVRVVTRTESEPRVTHNVIAETDGTGKAVMVGAHLDSRQEGPGINDNGSGSAALLEIALRAAELEFDRPIRFAWWGAEELGLLGSEYYVGGLSAAEREQIGCYLNFDMIASPNHTYRILDGDDSDRMGAGPGPEGSAEVERVFQRYFGKRGLPYTGADLTGRSDYGPFVRAGIPAGGLFTGAEAVKTEEEARLFGGTPGAPYDPCYHKACDNLRNVNAKALEVMTGAVAWAISELAG